MASSSSTSALSSPGVGWKIPRNVRFLSLEAVSRCSISYSNRSSRVRASSLSSNSSLISLRSSCVSCFSLITSSSILTRVWPSLWKLSSICLLSVALCWCGQWRICEKRVSMFCCAACMKVLQSPSQGPGLSFTSMGGGGGGGSGGKQE